MASSATSNLRLELQVEGENEDDWGDRANTSFAELLEDALTEVATLTGTGGTDTLTALNYTEDEARKLVLKCTGTLTSNQAIEIPAVPKHYLFWNATSGNYKTTIGVNGQTAVQILQGVKQSVWCDGTDVHLMGPDSAGGITGDVKYSVVPTAAAGWLKANGDTIGSQASGATHAHEELEALYSAIWDSHADAQAAVSSGRGGSAAADFAANKTLTMPDLTGRVLAGLEASATRLTTAGGFTTGGATDGDSTGGETVTLVAANFEHNHTGPSHTHTGPSHTHTGPSHTHTMGNHTHSVTTGGAVGSPSTVEGGGAASVASTAHTHTATSGGPSTNTTDAGGTGATGASGTDATGAGGTGNTGAVQNLSASAVKTLPPIIVESVFIKK